MQYGCNMHMDCEYWFFFSLKYYCRYLMSVPFSAIFENDEITVFMTAFSYLLCSELVRCLMFIALHLNS